MPTIPLIPTLQPPTYWLYCLIGVVVLVCLIKYIVYDLLGWKFCDCEKFEYVDPLKINEQIDKTNGLTFQEQFPDIVPYSNTLYGLTGIEKCYDVYLQKGGTCLEYGPTGNAWWFPPKSPEKQKELTDINTYEKYPAFAGVS